MNQDYQKYMACSFDLENVIKQISRLKTISETLEELRDIRDIDKTVNAIFFDKNRANILIDYLINKYPELRELTPITTVKIFTSTTPYGQNYSNICIRNKTEAELIAGLMYIRNCIPSIAIYRHIKGEILEKLIKSVQKEVK